MKPFSIKNKLFSSLSNKYNPYIISFLLIMGFSSSLSGPPSSEAQPENSNDLSHSQSIQQELSTNTENSSEFQEEINSIEEFEEKFENFKERKKIFKNFDILSPQTDFESLTSIIDELIKDLDLLISSDFIEYMQDDIKEGFQAFKKFFEEEKLLNILKNGVFENDLITALEKLKNKMIFNPYENKRNKKASNKIVNEEYEEKEYLYYTLFKVLASLSDNDIYQAKFRRFIYRELPDYDEPEETGDKYDLSELINDELKKLPENEKRIEIFKAIRDLKNRHYNAKRSPIDERVTEAENYFFMELSSTEEKINKEIEKIEMKKFYEKYKRDYFSESRNSKKLKRKSKLNIEKNNLTQEYTSNSREVQEENLLDAKYKKKLLRMIIKKMKKIDKKEKKDAKVFIEAVFDYFEEVVENNRERIVVLI